MFETLEIKNNLTRNYKHLSNKGGIIKHPGNIIVFGNIENGLILEAEGDIKVTGNIGASIIKTKGSLIVKGGLKGDSKAIIQANKLDISYIENSKCLISGSISIERTCINSEIYCSKNIVFQTGGKIIGGTVSVSKKLMVDSIGSTSYSPTNVYFGQNYVILNRIKIGNKKLRIKQFELSQLNNKINSEELSDKRKEIYKSKSNRLLKDINEHNTYISELINRYNTEVYLDNKIIIKAQIFKGVSFECGKDKLYINENRKGGSFHYDLSKKKIIQN